MKTRVSLPRAADLLARGGECIAWLAEMPAQRETRPRMIGLSRFSCIIAFVLLSASGVLAASAREVPTTLASHPGNIFLERQEVIVSVPNARGQWALVDYEGNSLRSVAGSNGPVSLGTLPVGFYRLRQPESNQWISLGVISRLQAPTPLTSPSGIHLALSFTEQNRMADLTSLTALAGLNWTRDLLSWQELEPRRGEFAISTTRYNISAAVQKAAGLQILQVMAASPDWANPQQKRFPTDLRDAFLFCKAVGQRFKANWLAFEPWNEADFTRFGGHNGSEIASFQKAAYLGLKAGNPKIIACQNVFAFDDAAHLKDFQDNEAWPYFDTYNFHHYEPVEELPALYARHRAVSAGRPMWVTEAARAVRWAGDPAQAEPTESDLRVQSENVTKTFATSLYHGAAKTFYFMLGHYVEEQTQFGLLRPDLTPRPSYLALCAVGRFMADAKPVGQVRSTNTALRAYVFRARPDGRDRSVLVAWTTNTTSAYHLPAKPEAIFDHLGRPQAITRDLHLTSAPIYVVLPNYRTDRFSLGVPPAPAPYLSGRPCPIVFQALGSETNTDWAQSAFALPAEPTQTIKFYAYNFSDKPVSGSLEMTAENGWKATYLPRLTLAPMERKELQITLDGTSAIPHIQGRVVLRGRFGSAGSQTLSVRLLHGTRLNQSP